MRIDPEKLDLALARKCKTISELRKQVSPQTLVKVRRGEEIKPRTLGRIANALGVDPADIIEGVIR